MLLLTLATTMRLGNRVLIRASSPICLSSFYDEPAEESVEKTAEKRRDVETGLAPDPKAVPRAPKAANEKQATDEPPEVGDEVLKMKRCRHMFHARCLATWFLQRRYDCPVCRIQYYQPVDEEEAPRRETLSPSTIGLPALPFW